MKLIFAYDAWCLRRIEALLAWLEEWMSISQPRVEQGLIVIYITLLNTGRKFTTTFITLQIICSLGIALMMWWLHRRPAAVREASKRSSMSAMVRIFFQTWFLLLVVVCTVSRPIDYQDIAMYLDYLLFFLMNDISSKGKPGRRRKLALEKLKELFGSAWIPKPVAVPR
jgi:hypothetical protein